jgi:5'-3' exonuclease
MGIKHFFPWFRKRFSPDVGLETDLKNPTKIPNIDVLGIDLNAIFHPCAQSVYKYGSSATLMSRRLLRAPSEAMLMSAIHSSVMSIIKTASPTHTVLLCVDGVAGLAKMTQQRQRRYRSLASPTFDHTTLTFDSNMLSAGTPLMARICDHLESTTIPMIRQQFGVNVVFSRDTVCGEGEHKIVRYMSDHFQDRRCAIFSPDADLIMIALVSNINNIWVLREQYMNPSKWYVVHVHNIRACLVNEFKNIYDFVVICFLIGNDFLPHMPSLKMDIGILDTIINIYRCVVSTHLINPNTLQWNELDMRLFFSQLASMEEQFWIQIYGKTPEYSLFKTHVFKTDYSIGFRDYAQFCGDYRASRLSNDADNASMHYIQGCEWILRYYTTGIPSWYWFYPYHYSPLVSDIANYVCVNDNVHFTPPTSLQTPPTLEQQLMCILPPYTIENIFDKPKVQIYEDKYRVDSSSIKIDRDGTTHEMDEVVIVPFIDRKGLF